MPRPAQRNQRLILLEFNELCPHLVDRFIDEGALPNFKRLREASETFITHTHEEVSAHPSRRASKTGFADTLPLTHVRGKLEQALAFQA